MRQDASAHPGARADAGLSAAAGARSSFWPILLGLGGIGLAFYPTLLSRLDRMQADPADTRHLNYILEHVHRWLVSAPGHAPLWSPALFFPEANTGAYTELLLGVVPFYTPWRLAGLPPDTAFQLWMLTVAALNFAAAYLLLRRPLACSPQASSFGAFLFAFGAPRLAQLNHQHLLPHFFTVGALYALLRAFERHREGRPREASAWLLALAAALTAQLYACYYYGWFLGFALGVAAIWALASKPLRGPFVGLLKAQWKALAVAGILSAAALAPMAAHYLGAARAVGLRQYVEAEGMIPRLQSWFDLGPDNWLYGWTARLYMFRTLPMEWEQRLGIGLLTTGLAGYALWRERRRPAVRLMLLTAGTILLLATMYRGGWTPWWLVFHGVPGARAIRAVSRIGMLLLIPAAVGLALFLDRARPGARRTVAVALGLVCLAEQGQSLLSYDKEEKRADVEAVARAIAPSCKAFFYSPVGTPRGPEETQLDGMWAQLSTGVPTVNGYSSNFPKGWDPLFEHAVRSDADRARISAALDAWRTSRGVDPESVCWVQLPAR